MSLMAAVTLSVEVDSECNVSLDEKISITVILKQWNLNLIVHL